jgi:hypothetical protein
MKGYEPYWLWVQKYWTSRQKPLEFKKHKYLVQIYQDQSKELVWQKSAQAGLTERMLTEALWLPDQFNENSLYLFPTAGTISDMVQERIDGPLTANKYLAGASGRSRNTSRLLNDRHADKVGLKKMSKGFAFFRGSNSPTQITSVAADAVFVDELDRMEQENIPYFNKRLKHSARKWLRWASTPTIPNFGIDLKFQESDQNYCHVKCNHCGEWQMLDYWSNIDEERLLLICSKCKSQLIPWECEFDWIPENPDANIRGYFVSQLYSPQLDVKELVEESRKTAEWEVMQFYNQSLGLAYEPKGSKITEEDFNACRRDYTIPHKYEGMRSFMGIDVGTVFHVVIQDEKRLLFVGTRKEVKELVQLATEFHAVSSVIDGAPEPRASEQFASGAQGKNYLCWYTDTTNFRKGEWYQTDIHKVNTGRTMSLDMSTNQVKKQLIEMPKNLEDYPEFKNQMKALVRVVRENKHGDKVAEYLKISEDHFRHAFNYSTIAKDIYLKGGVPEIFTL